MTENELKQRVWDYFRYDEAHEGMGQGTCYQVVEKVLEELRIPVLPDGQFNTHQHPPDADAFITAMRADPSAKPATGKKLRRSGQPRLRGRR